MTLPDTIQVGDLTIRPLRRLLITPDGEHTMDPLVMKLLVCLISRGGNVVTREELVEEVWPDGFAGEQSLSRAIWALRTALGDDARDPRFVETVPRIGYRFIPDVNYVSKPDGAPDSFSCAVDQVVQERSIPEVFDRDRLLQKVRRLQVAVGILGGIVVCLVLLMLTARPDIENTEIIKVRNQDGTIDSVMVKSNSPVDVVATVGEE